MNPAPWYIEVPTPASSVTTDAAGVPRKPIPMWCREGNDFVRRNSSGAVIARVSPADASGRPITGSAGADAPASYVLDKAALAAFAPQALAKISGSEIGWTRPSWSPPGVTGTPPKIPLLGLVDAALVDAGYAVEIRQGRADSEALLRAAFTALRGAPLPAGHIQVAYTPQDPGVFTMSAVAPAREGTWEIVSRPMNVGQNALRCKISANEFAEIRRSAPRGTKYVFETFNANGDRIVRLDPTRTMEDAINAFRRSYSARIVPGMMAGAVPADLSATFHGQNAGTTSLVTEGDWHFQQNATNTMLYTELDGPDDWAVQIEAANDRAVSAALVDESGRVLVDVMAPTPSEAIAKLQTKAKTQGVRLATFATIPASILAKFVAATKININTPQEKTMSNPLEAPSTFSVAKQAYTTAAIGKAVTATERKILDLVKSKLRQAYPSLPDHEGYDRMILTMIPILVREAAIRAPESVPETVRKYVVVGSDAAIFFDAVKNVDDLGSMLASVSSDIIEMMAGLGQMASMANGAGGMFGAIEDKTVVNLEAHKEKEKVRANAGGSGSSANGS
jgi:hypothetical protein